MSDELTEEYAVAVELVALALAYQGEEVARVLEMDEGQLRASLVAMTHMTSGLLHVFAPGHEEQQLRPDRYFGEQRETIRSLPRAAEP